MCATRKRTKRKYKKRKMREEKPSRYDTKIVNKNKYYLFSINYGHRRSTASSRLATHNLPPTHVARRTRDATGRTAAPPRWPPVCAPRTMRLSPGRTAASPLRRVKACVFAARSAAHAGSAVPTACGGGAPAVSAVSAVPATFDKVSK